MKNKPGTLKKNKPTWNHEKPTWNQKKRPGTIKTNLEPSITLKTHLDP